MSQIQKKFIADNAVDGSKIRLLNNETLRSRNAAGSGDIDILKVLADNTLEFITQPRAASALPVPSSAKDYITVEYIENVILGKQDAKDSVIALADSDQLLTGTAPLIIDAIDFGLTTSTPVKRLALTGQTDASENGIYDYTADGTDYTLVRSSDMDSSVEVTNGLYFNVTSGTVYSGYEVLLTTADPIVLDTTNLTFAKYPSTLSLTAGDMLTKTGNDFKVDLATVSGLKSTNPGNAAGQLMIKTDTASLEKDQSTALDSGTGFLMAKRARRENFTLSAGNITAQYLDLANVATEGSIRFGVAGAAEQIEGVDFSVNYTGGASSKTRVTFLGGLATGGVSALVATDKVQISYESF